MSKATLGVIFGNRDFFPDKLVNEARQDITRLFNELNIDGIMLKENETKLGSVETWEHAKACAELFRKHKEKIDGILVVLPNFGDERGIADTIKLSGLDVPILVQGYPDSLDLFSIERRRDSFCGKISVCNSLKQYGYAFTLTSLHTVHPLSVSFRKDLAEFLGVCRVVKGLRNLRVGAIGARPAAFTTVRSSEKILQANGINVITVDFSEMIGAAQKFKDDDSRVKAKIAEISSYADSSAVPPAPMVRMAKLGLAITDWIDANDIQATALQCWNSIQKNYGVNVCTLMSMMSEKLIPSACEVDVTGVATMYALQLASGTPSALVDWNNNYGDNPDRCVLFHCGNWAKSFLPDIKIKNADILANTLGNEVTFGAVAGRTPVGPMTYARIGTDDMNGKIHVYIGEGNFTNDPLDTFGSIAVVEVPGLQKLVRHICLNGFEHHAAMSGSQVAGILKEAFENYFGWEVYHHQGN